MYTNRSVRQIAGPSRRLPHGKCGRSSQLPVVRSLCPYRTLGVAEGADEKEIKKAYRQLALKYHPDVSETEDAARRFISIQEAYEILTGKARGKQAGSNRSNSNNDWDFHDWFWQFRMSRSWERQRGGSPRPNTASASGPFQPQETKEGIRTQLAGLRHRAAIRRMQEQNSSPSSTSGPSSTQPASEPSTTATAAPFTEAADVSDGANYTTPAAQSEPAQQQQQKPKFHMGEERRSHLSSQIAGLKRKGVLKQQLSN